ncbi:MAG: type II toxin-antitoxin system RelE/ParE family toxin [Reyranellaceae bacterium]
MGRQALADLEDIADYLGTHDSPVRAEQVTQRIEQTFSSLADMPNRGAHPPELLEIGNRTFGEVHYKPYRIVYRVYERQVVILVIADGRRDMRGLLARRLLGA